ncbi:uncharacterized protein [Anoplolepis gracilipes]|uniref:uncharacterized protein isoform X2 n=1 Tax=Anoplolepis gracilipes TaxID=354296 RepID=UPI003BA3E03F
MPRCRDSDDEAEEKTGDTQRQPTALRRSTRIKQGKSPSSESDASNSQPLRNTRNQRTIMDNIGSETLKSENRTRKPSISSDISESTEIDILGTPRKRATRSSLSAVTSIGTPTKINTRITSKRLTRAGSETRSPLPVARTTRRTRASSVDLESLVEQSKSHPGTPVRTRKRVSGLLSESPVKEEAEKKNLIPYVRLDATIVEADEFTNSGNSDSSPDKALRSQQRINKKRQSIDKNEDEEDNSYDETLQLSEKKDEIHDKAKITVDNETLEEETLSNNTTDKGSMQENVSNLSNSKEEELEIIKTPSGIEKALKQSTTKELMIQVENRNMSVEEQKGSPSNKENQTLNIINETLLESNIQSTTNVTPLNTKCLTPILANKASSEKETKFTKNESNKRRHSKESIEDATKHDILSKEIIDNINLIEERMDISSNSSISDSTYKQKDLESPLRNDVTKRKSFVDEAGIKSITNDTNKSILSQHKDIGSVEEAIKDKTPVKQINKSTENITEETTKSDKVDKTEHTIINIDSDVNKDSNEIELNKITHLSKDQSKTEQESSTSVIDGNEMRLELSQDENEASNILHFKSDHSVDLVVMPSVNKNDQSNILEKQSVLESSNVTPETINSTSNESNKDNAVIQNIRPSNVIEVFGKFTSMSSTKTERKLKKLDGIIKQYLKRKNINLDDVNLDGYKGKNLQLKNQKDANTNIEPNVSTDVSMVHDISNGNSNQKRIEKENDVEIIAGPSNSQLLKKPENESEAKCDLSVNKKLVAENMKVAKEVESEYDSDDTVILKSLRDPVVTKNKELFKNQDVNRDNRTFIIFEGNMDYLPEESFKSIKQRMSMLEKSKNFLLSSTEDESEDDFIVVKESCLNLNSKTVLNQSNDRPVSRLNKSGQTKATERSLKTHDESDKQIEDNENELNRSSQENKKDKSLSKSMERRKSLNKSSTKDIPSRQEDETVENIVINKSRGDYSEKELDNTEHLEKKLKEEKRSLNKSQNKDEDANESKKNLSKSVNAKTLIHLNDDASDNSEIFIPAMDFGCKSYPTDKSDSTVACKGSDSDKKSSDDEDESRRRRIYRSFSKIRYENNNVNMSVGSDIEKEYNLGGEEEQFSDDNPSFLSFLKFTDNDNSNVNMSVDSDIEKEYNLGGKEQQFSDDNVFAHECRASESEISDPDDNGSDLADFIVDDNEVEEEEEEEDEDVDDEGEKESNSEEESKENMEEARNIEEEEVDDESENEQSMEEEAKVAKKKKIKDKNSEQAYSENVKDKNENCDINIFNEGDIKEKSIKNTLSDVNTKMLSLSEKMAKKKLKNKVKKSNMKENKTILLDTSDSDSSIKNTSCTQKNENTILLSTPNTSNLSIKKRRKSTVQFSPKDVTEQNLIEQLNKSEVTFTKELPKPRILMECSTPKLDTCMQQFQFSTPESCKRNSEINDTKTDSAKTTRVSSFKKNKSKKDSILKEDISLKEFNQSGKKLINSSLPSDLVEAVEKTRLSKPRPYKNKLHRTIDVIHTESPTIRYLRKEKLSESTPILKLNIEIDSGKQKLLPIEKTKDVTQTKTKLGSDEEKVSNLPSDDVIQKKRKKKQKKHKVQAENTSSGNITEKALSQEIIEPQEIIKSDVPKKKKRVKIIQDTIVDDIYKDSEINEKEKKQKKRKFSAIEQDKNVSVKNVPQKNICKKKPKLAQRERKNYEIIDNSEDLSADMIVEKKSKRQKVAESKEIISEKLSKKKKKKKKEEKTFKTLQSGISKLKSDKKLASDTNESKDTAFIRARNEVLEALYAAERNIKAKKELKKKQKNVENPIKEQDLRLKLDEKRRKKVLEKNEFLPSSIGRMKRLSDEVIENLTDQPKAKKRQKLSRNQEQIMPEHSWQSKATTSKNDGFMWSSGSTTQFFVVDLQKAKKQSKSSSTITSFRQHMLAKNREPVSAYMMYLKKQQATSNSRSFHNAF